MFIVRVSDNFYNNNEATIQKEKNKLKLVKKFIKDIQKEPKLPQTPSMAVHKILLRSQQKVHCESLRHMNSMQDLQPTPLATKDISSTKSSMHNQSVRRGSFSGYVSGSADSQQLAESGKSLQPSPFARQEATSQRAIGTSREPLKVARTRTRIISEAETKIKTIIDGSDSRVNCTVCVERPSDAVHEPCFHGGICASCAINCYLKDQQRKCPICREVADPHKADPEDLPHRNERHAA